MFSTVKRKYTRTVIPPTPTPTATATPTPTPTPTATATPTPTPTPTPSPSPVRYLCCSLYNKDCCIDYSLDQILGRKMLLHHLKSN